MVHLLVWFFWFFWRLIFECCSWLNCLTLFMLNWYYLSVSSWYIKDFWEGLTCWNLFKLKSFGISGGFPRYYYVFKDKSATCGSEWGVFVKLSYWCWVSSRFHKRYDSLIIFLLILSTTLQSILILLFNLNLIRIRVFMRRLRWVLK